MILPKGCCRFLVFEGSDTPNTRWKQKDFPDDSVLWYDRPLGPQTIPPAPLWSASLGCYVRPQPSEFQELPRSSGAYHRTVSNAIPVMLRGVLQPEEAE